MDIVIKNTTVVTMDDRRRVLKNFSIGIEDGRIVEISQKIGCEADYEINGEGMVALPGLINAHTHLAMTLFRGTADDMPLQDWLTKAIWPVEAQLQARHVYAGSLLGCLENIASGVTTFNDMYFYLEEVARAAEEAGVRAILSFPLLDVAGEEQGKELLKKARKGLSKFAKENSRIRVFVGPHAPYTCSQELLMKARELAREYNTGIHIHVAETEKEVEDSLREKGKRPFEYLESIGFLGDNVLAAHAVHVSRKEMEILKKRGVSIAHCPVSNMKLCSGVAPVKEYLSSGINVALGTDGCASNNTLDMFEEIKMAALLQKVYTGDASAVRAMQALEMATINGARALGIADEVGSIEAGKRADIVLINMKKPSLTPNFSPVSHLVYATRGCDVYATIVDGEILMLNGEFRTLDPEKVMRFAEEEALDLFRRAGQEDRLSL